MSAELQQLFQKFIHQFEDELASIDEQYSDDGDEKDECTKHLEKLQVYEKFTDGLRDISEHYLQVISQLNEGLAHIDSASESASTEQIAEDMDFLRKCLESRVKCEEEAIKSLIDLEEMFSILSRENQALTAENKHLKSTIKNVDATACEDITSNVIETLKHENKELKNIIKQNKETIKLLGNDSSINHNDENMRNENYENQLAALKLQLNEKSQTIEMLTHQLQNMSSPSSSTHSTDSNNVGSISDVEQNDNEKLQMFKNGYEELKLILKDKYEQLREKRAKLAELTQKLVECEMKGNEADRKLIIQQYDKIQELNREVEQLRNESSMRCLDVVEIETQKDQLNEEVTELQIQNNKLNEKLQNMKEHYEQNQKQVEDFDIALKKMKEREDLMAQKFVLQEKHVSTLLSERQWLMSLDNEMLNSIAFCKNELAKYKTEEQPIKHERN
ncbi:golgin IMH1-like [Contarinia nasturtii]|uniref:golgin IMH1-like n=1 Tax=Contarinia nasturtii TaxID=265458 RepID=UPI0012D468BE|nr:golgin IMH1-like [Contarinia nasturtii]